MLTAPAANPDPLILRAHPATPCPAVARLTVALGAVPGVHGPVLHLRYVLQGDLAALRWPAPAFPGAADGLWRHTCFEVFIGAPEAPTEMPGTPDAPAYREFNFAPNGQWASYAFRAERERDARIERAAPVRPLRMACQRQGDTFTLTATLPAAAWPAPAHTCRLGLSAVIETQDGALACFALTHPREAPDFHHRAGWTAPAPEPAESVHRTATHPV
ncbi:MAG: DOMON-like domain-containing protein [Brachymonas sp.]|nr:DOMON-like domain-containing protein [Brachymonas sp.]